MGIAYSVFSRKEAEWIFSPSISNKFINVSYLTSLFTMVVLVFK